MKTLFDPNIPKKKLSSPEQLDQTMQIAGPMYWTFLLAILIALTVVSVWSYTGSIPTKAAGQGTLIRPGGVFNVFSSGGGTIKKFDVNAGDHIEVGQTIAEIDQPKSDNDIREEVEHLAQLRNQTQQAVSLRKDTANLRIKSLDLERANDRREIEEQQKLLKLAQDEVTVDEQLFTKGLITRKALNEGQQRVVALQSGIAHLQSAITQADSQAFESGWQPDEVKRQQQMLISGSEGKLLTLRDEARTASLVDSPVRGEVVEEKVYAGARIAPGTPIASVQADTSEVIAIVYVPSGIAKDIKVDMDAEVSPSTAKREEYGFIRGKVTSVAHFPATQSGMMSLLENDSLVESLRQQGPVTEVRVVLEKATDTPSGFRWSSSRGPETEIGPGTLCQVQIITRQQKPITLVFPFLKKLMGLH